MDVDSLTVFHHPVGADRLRPVEHRLGVRLAVDKVDVEWIGALMAANYLGLVVCLVI